MSYKLGLVGLGTSHPAKWTRIIRELKNEIDVEIVAAWDSGEVCRPGYAEEFCRQHNIPRAVTLLEEMTELVDGAIVHSANWDQHVQQARLLVEAGRGVLFDKPMVGNVHDARTIQSWVQQGKRITGGSSVRFAPEIIRLGELPESERGEFHSAMAVCGVDRFFYGVHGFALLCGLIGPGLQTVEVLEDGSWGESERVVLKLTWKTGQVGILHQSTPARLPLQFIAVSEQDSVHGSIDTQHVYTEFLRRSLRYLAGEVPSPPAPIEVLMEPELAAIATIHSRNHNGIATSLDHPSLVDVAYDGTEFARRYRERK